MLFKKKWLVEIERPRDRSGYTYFRVYENSKQEIYIKDGSHFIELIEKFKPKLYAINYTTFDILMGWKIKNEIIEKKYLK